MGRIRRKADNFFYGILNSIHEWLLNHLKENLKNDPEYKEACEKFDEANEKMADAWSELGDNPEKFIDKS